MHPAINLQEPRYPMFSQHFHFGLRAKQCQARRTRPRAQPARPRQSAGPCASSPATGVATGTGSRNAWCASALQMVQILARVEAAQGRWRRGSCDGRCMLLPCEAVVVRDEYATKLYNRPFPALSTQVSGNWGQYWDRHKKPERIIKGDWAGYWHRKPQRVISGDWDGYFAKR